MWFDSVILDDIDDEIDSHCRTFLHPNGYTNVSICNCKYPSISVHGHVPPAIFSGAAVHRESSQVAL